MWKRRTRKGRAKRAAKPAKPAAASSSRETPAEGAASKETATTGEDMPVIVGDAWKEYEGADVRKSLARKPSMTLAVLSEQSGGGDQSQRPGDGDTPSAGQALRRGGSTRRPLSGREGKGDNPLKAGGGGGGSRPSSREKKERDPRKSDGIIAGWED